MRKLSLFIVAAGATLCVSLAHADDVAVTVTTTTDVPVEMVDPVPVDASVEAVDPTLVVEELELHPVDQVVDVAEEGDPASGVVDSGGVKTDETATPDGEIVTDETATTDEKPVTDDVLDPVMYTTSSGTVDPRPEGCMECRTLTGESAADAVEAPAPEVMVDVLDGNSTGVDVMDPVEGKKRSSH